MILVISPKTTYAAKRILEECKMQNADCRIVSAEDLANLKFSINIADYDVLYIRNPYFKTSPKYIPQVIDLAKQFKVAGKRLVDAKIASGFLGMGKWEDYRRLQDAGLLIPESVLGFHPKSEILNHKSYIIKWQYGMKGKGVFLITSEKDFKKIPTSMPKSELILQEYIEADYEYKIITVGYKALPVILRFRFNKKLGRVDFNSVEIFDLNVGQARGLPYKTPYAEAGQGPALQSVISLAEKSSRILGRELAKVDILQKDDQLYVLEVNRFPGLRSFEELTGYNAVGEFVKYLRL